MTKNAATNIVCAAAALFVTTLSFAEVTSVSSIDFEYDQPQQVALQA